MKRVEIERRLSQNEYLTLLMDADYNKRPIRKTRYLLSYAHQYLEVDVFPFWKDKAVVEIELSDENQQVVFPPQLQILREITGDPAYTNSALATIR